MAQIDDMRDLQTHCFILDAEEFKRSVAGFRLALERLFSKSIIAYSVKTNSLPACLSLANSMGVYAEVVSADEYELALLCGFPKDHIVYNGPMKSRETFLDAIVNGAVVNIETKRELGWLRDLPSDGRYEVGLRLNVNISHISPEDTTRADDNSRFGFSDDNPEFGDAIAFIKGLENVRLSGMHIHRTSSSRSVRFYRNLLEYACRTIIRHELSLDYLDIGGGYFGIFPGKPSYRDYCEAFHEVLSRYGMQDLRVVVEPGNGLVASCFSFLSEVIDVKLVGDDLSVATTDGSRNDVDPLFRKSTYLSEIFYGSDLPAVKEQVVCGCSCLENDRLFTLTDKPRLEVGDRVCYHNVGAYTMCLSPLFVRYFPRVYRRDMTGYVLVRDSWTAEDYMAGSVLM